MDRQNTIGFKSRIVLKNKRNLIFISVLEIKYALSSSYYAELYLKDSTKHINRISLYKLLDLLPESIFFRVNKSTIINISFVKELISEGLGEYTIIMNDGMTFSLSSKYKNSFFNKITVIN
jgi:two-component system LytT family response regulator